MSLILNKKEKFIDLVITNQGKKKLSENNFDPKYVSFSDGDSAYNASDNSGQDGYNIDRFNIETPSSLKTDVIVYEYNDKGKLNIPFNVNIETSNENVKYTVINGEVNEQTTVNNSLSYKIPDKEIFASSVEKIAKSSLSNLKNNNIINTFFGYEKDNQQFNLSKDKHTFVISNSFPFPDKPKEKQVDIDHAEPFMFDNKLSHYKNFQFLPPKNTDGSSYGEYEDLRSTTKAEISDIKKELGYNFIEKNKEELNSLTTVNYSNNIPVRNRIPNVPIESVVYKEYSEIYFKDTSTFNNLIVQIYEANNISGKMKKLDIVDAGEFIDDDDPENPVKRVFYVGKVLFDSRDFPTFVNIFTVILD